MKIIQYTTLFLALSTNCFATVEATCQVKLLKFAVNELDKEFNKIAGHVHEISEIDYNYGVKNMPQVVFISKPAIYNNGYPCLIKVAVNPSTNGKNSCPDYTLNRIWSNCEYQNE